MRKFEFKVVPVPARCVRVEGDDTSPVAATLETALNTLGVEGWEFHRSETLSIKRGFMGLGGSDEETVLVFRRERVLLEDRPVKDTFKSRRVRTPRIEADKTIPEPRRITVIRDEDTAVAA